jgi:hypothetical protein
MINKSLVPITLALSLVAIAPAASASAQTSLNNRTVMTFSQPVEVPGRVLPAGTYTFELNDSMANRHIVQIFDAGGSKLIGLVLTVPSRRPAATGETVVKFAEVAAGEPQALRTWFYPGQTVGQEMVYPKTRAQQLAVSSNVIVPAVDDSFYADANVETMKTAEVVSVEPTVTVGPPARVETPRAVVATERKALPRTASTLPLIALFGFATLAFGLVLRGLAARRTRA